MLGYSLEIWLLSGCWSGSWGVGALEHWRCAGAHLVVVSVSLCFHFVCMFVSCKECWLVSFEGWEACWRHLEVFRLDKDLTWVQWVWRIWFERFGGVEASKRSDLSVLSVERLIWEVWRCVDFKRIWLECLECGEVDLRGLEVLRLPKDLTWVSWV